MKRYIILTVLFFCLAGIVLAEDFGNINGYYWKIYYGKYVADPIWHTIDGIWYSYTGLYVFDTDGNIKNSSGVYVGTWHETLYPGFHMLFDTGDSLFGSIKYIASPSPIICGTGEIYIGSTLITIKIIMVRGKAVGTLTTKSKSHGK